ncbi:MAG TPA: arylsulfatase [Gemmatimonadales bacterium]|nr:arylsulfatase [Gemmatimonadales bacterium]
MKMVRSTLAALVAVHGIATGFPPATTAQAPRPNIVYIITDDQGWKDVGFHGSYIKTPNIDALALSGVKLEQYYAEPMCTPSRAALMTGRYPFRYGLQTLVIPSAGKYGLPTDEWPLPQALKEAGYATSIVGKWHLGHADRKYWPRSRGFDHQYGPLLGEIDYFTHSAHGTRDWFRDDKPLKEEGYVTTLLGDEAVRVIQRRDPSRPFFLYLAFTAPHTPYQVPQAALAQYASIEDPARRSYAAMITAMDAEIGKVLHALDENKLRENTIVVFQSDNGGPASARFTGEIDMSKSTIPPDNSPFREGKGTLYEGGTRVVAVVNWPGRIPAGSEVRGPVHIVDMFPTLAGLAGISLGSHKPLDGLDMWPTLSQGVPSPRTEVVYNLEPFRAGLRQNNWKLIWQATLPSKVELFDIAADSAETTNLADKNPDVVARLEQRVQILSREAVAPLIFGEAMPALKAQLFSSVVLPADVKAVENEP